MPTTLKPVKVPLVRRLSQKQAERIRVLMDCCGVLTADDRIEIHAGSTELGGRPLKNLMMELSMLLHGHEPKSRCKLIQ